MLDEYKKPEMIIIAGPNGSGKTSVTNRLYVYDNSVDGEEAKLLFRLTDGFVTKMYTDEIPAWAKIIVG